MSQRLKTLRKAKGLTQEGLAELVDTSHATIQRLESGKILLKKHWAERLAPHLGVEPANLLFNNEDLILAKEVGEHELIEVESKFERLPVIGKVEAGSFSTSNRYPECDWNYIPLPISQKYPGLKRYCLEVRGNSMNLEFAPGSLVLCIDMIDLGEDPQDSEIYVVDHIVHGEVESTLKELRIMPDGLKYLWPRSSDPDHQQPIKINGNEGEEIRLRAKVVGDYQER